MLIIKSHSAGSRINEIENGECFSPLGIYHHGLYIASKSHLVIVYDSIYGELPFGISSDRYDDIYQTAIKHPDALFISEKYGNELKLSSDSISIYAELTERKNPQPFPHPDPDNQFIKEAADMLLSRKKTGFVPLVNLISGAEPIFDSESRAYGTYALEIVNKAFNSDSSISVLSELIGLGKGLTPSGDDFLCGLIYYLKYTGNNKYDPFKEITDNLSKTNVISQNYLISATSGDYTEFVYDYVKALYSEDFDYLSLSTDNLLKFGNSSGGDIAAGVLLASQIFT